MSKVLERYLKLEKLFFDASVKHSIAKEAVGVHGCFFCHSGDAIEALDEALKKLGTTPEAFVAAHAKRQGKLGRVPLFAVKDGIISEADKPKDRERANNICIASGYPHLSVLDVLHTAASIL